MAYGTGHRSTSFPALVCLAGADASAQHVLEESNPVELTDVERTLEWGVGACASRAENEKRPAARGATGQSNREVQRAKGACVELSRIGPRPDQPQIRSRLRLCFQRTTNTRRRADLAERAILSAFTTTTIARPAFARPRVPEVKEGDDEEYRSRRTPHLDRGDRRGAFRQQSIAGSDIAALIQSVFDTLGRLAADEPAVTAELTPAVPIRRSLTDDHIVCLEDGKKLKMLKRHLMSDHGLTPEAYRAKWGLRPDYPMVAPNYSAQRSSPSRSASVASSLHRRRPRQRRSQSAGARLPPDRPAQFGPNHVSFMAMPASSATRVPVAMTCTAVQTAVHALPSGRHLAILQTFSLPQGRSIDS